MEKASDTGIRRGQKESYYSGSKECLEVVKTSLDLLP